MDTLAQRRTLRLVASVLVVCTGALVTLGMVMFFSAEMTLAGRDYPTTPMLFYGAGFLVLGVAAWVDYRRLGRWAWVLYLMGVASLVAVLLYGPVHRGAQRWLEFYGIRFQPSEFAKLALVVMLAAYGARHQRSMSRLGRGFLVPLGLIGLMLVLIFKEPDWGTTILLGTVGGLVLLVAGARWRHVLCAAALATVTLSLLLVNNEHRWRRVLTYVHPHLMSADDRLQNEQALIGLQRGGLTGVGLGESRQKYSNLPDHKTDFILAIVGEELGLVCSLGVVLAFGTVVFCGMLIAWRARDPFGTLLASGLTFLVGLQAFVNIGVVTWVLPNKGLPLPFISRGGSNLLVTLMAVGILVSIAWHSTTAPRIRSPLNDWKEGPEPQPT